MAGIADLLRRLRVPGVPGSPGAAGVPADRALQLATELTPVLELLDNAQSDASAILAVAAVRAEEHRAETAEQSRRVVADARAQVPPTRNAAAAAGVLGADTQLDEVVAGAREEAARIDHAAGLRSEEIVGVVLERVLDCAGHRRVG